MLGLRLALLEPEEPERTISVDACCAVDRSLFTCLHKIIGSPIKPFV